MTNTLRCDPDVLTGIERKIGRTRVTEILDLFLEQAPSRMTRVLGGDMESAAAALHSIRSSAAMLGAIGLSEICERMERLAVQDEHEAFDALLDELHESFTEAQAFVRKQREARRVVSRIAVVEDNADNRLLVRALLEELHEVSEYETGADALDGFRTEAPDLVLLDVSLPGMDGTEVLARIREDPRLRRVPVIALTAHAMSGDRERFLALGFDAYVAKPIDDELLFSEIQRLLEGSGAGSSSE